MYLISFRQFFANSSALINLIGLCLLAYHVSCHECYICGVGDNPRNCSEFVQSASFKETCPSGVNSCCMQIESGVVKARSCGEVYSIRDCRVANEIMYCYCAANLCNGDTNPSFSDDEDFTEVGSGIQATTDTMMPETTSKPISSTSTSIHSRISFILHLLLLI